MAEMRHFLAILVAGVICGCSVPKPEQSTASSGRQKSGVYLSCSWDELNKVAQLLPKCEPTHSVDERAWWMIGIRSQRGLLQVKAQLSDAAPVGLKSESPLFTFDAAGFLVSKDFDQGAPLESFRWMPLIAPAALKELKQAAAEHGLDEEILGRTWLTFSSKGKVNATFWPFFVSHETLGPRRGNPQKDFPGPFEVSL